MHKKIDYSFFSKSFRKLKRIITKLNGIIERLEIKEPTKPESLRRFFVSDSKRQKYEEEMKNYEEEMKNYSISN